MTRRSSQGERGGGQNIGGNRMAQSDLIPTRIRGSVLNFGEMPKIQIGRPFGITPEGNN